MRILVLISTILVTSSAAWASKNSIAGSLGFDQGAATIGFEFENRTKKSSALSAFFLYGMDNAEYTAAGALQKGKLKTITVGGGFKLFLGSKRWHVFMTPAFGINMIDYIKVVGAAAAIETETTFGPILRTGIYYRFSRNLAVGLDYTRAFNWFSDTIGSQINYSTASVRYSL